MPNNELNTCSFWLKEAVHLRPQVKALQRKTDEQEQLLQEASAAIQQLQQGLEQSRAVGETVACLIRYA